MHAYIYTFISIEMSVMCQSFKFSGVSGAYHCAAFYHVILSGGFNFHCRYCILVIMFVVPAMYILIASFNSSMFFI